MKISALFATIALAQDERAMSLDKKIENAQTKCGVFMEKALVCEPPSEKIGKYTFRLDKVCKTILWMFDQNSMYIQKIDWRQLIDSLTEGNRAKIRDKWCCHIILNMSAVI